MSEEDHDSIWSRLECHSTSIGEMKNRFSFILGGATVAGLVISVFAGLMYSNISSIELKSQQRNDKLIDTINNVSSVLSAKLENNMEQISDRISNLERNQAAFQAKLELMGPNK